MMPLIELRVGNFIKGPLTLNAVFAPEIAPVESIILQLKLEHFIWFKANSDLYKLLEPVPLTEEWMRKFCNAGEHELRWDIHQYLFVVKRYEKYFLHFTDKGHLLEVKYVHHLQNLFLDLTGEELKVNENKISQSIETP